jgi:GNAT superfamily N-acetyltransferase
MYLLESYQGKGYGNLLLEHSFSKARELGFTEMVLETNKKLNKAIGLYKKHGFEEFSLDHLSDRCDLAMKKQLVF